MRTPPFSIRRRIKSFRFACNGLRLFFNTQHNAIIHAVATGIVLLLSWVIRLPLQQFLFIMAAIGLVWIAELFNTAIEQICDIVNPHQHPRVKYIKDISAAAVLVAAIVAVLTACIILIPALL